ncbi:MAG: VOC family protein [Myxococcales bacterium]|nr:VOC family protein [Myxococcales bacterium]
MALSNNTFCWNGIVSSDSARTLAFFPEVLGWSVQEIDMGGDTVQMLASAGTPLAHVRGPQAPGERSWWNNYFRVEDVDATVAAVKKAGGTVVVPPTDIPPGRFSTVATPSGAHLSLFREANPEDTDKPSTTGFIHWVDLHSKDLERDLAFIHEGLGLATSEFPMPSGAYHILNPEGRTRGGAMEGKNPEAPSMWLAWVAVDDVDQTLERVTRHGGKVLAPAWDADTVGRMAIAADPTGVAFGIITPPAAAG